MLGEKENYDIPAETEKRGSFESKVIHFTLYMEFSNL